MKTISDNNSQSILHSILKGYDQLNIKLNDEEVFNELSLTEPTLVSSFSKNSNIEQRYETLIIYYGEHLVGGISFFIAKNNMRKNKSNLYGRIDTVIAPKRFRKNGISRALILFAIHYINLTFGARLYSISCLAAHDAISRVLEGLQFSDIRNEEENFTRQSISFDTIDHENYANLIDEYLKRASHQINYKLHKLVGTIK